MSCFFHTWGPWEQIPETCEEAAICIKCGKIKKRGINHQFSEWAPISDDNCTYQRVCSRCHYSERETRHSFDELHYAAENSCTKIQRCQHCHYTKIKYHQHEFVEWQPINNISCIFVKACERCGFVAQSYVKHVWHYSHNAEEPIPSEDSATYASCLEYAIDLMKTQVKKITKLTDTLDLEENQRRKYIEQIYELELKIVNYQCELKSSASNVLGDICTRCFSVINFGITQEDISDAEYQE